MRSFWERRRGWGLMSRRSGGIGGDFLRREDLDDVYRVEGLGSRCMGSCC